MMMMMSSSEKLSIERNIQTDDGRQNTKTLPTVLSGQLNWSMAEEKAKM